MEADVNFRVVNSFLKKVKEKAKGTEVIGNLSAGQQLIKVIHHELSLLLGEKSHQIDLNQAGICNIMLVGLQGSGKTTSVAKLALYLKKKGKKVLLVPADIYRPAAIDQLKVLAASIEVDCYDSVPKTLVKEIVQAAQAQAKKEKHNVMIVDTAGRLQVDEKLMHRVASKVLGMGDVLTLVEKASKQFEGQDLANLEQRIKKNKFTLLDFQKQLEQIQKMGSLKSLIGMIPGFKMPAGQQIDENPMKKFNSILSSMTTKEKLDHHLVNGLRRKRIAKGSGVEVSDINQMLKQFETMRKMMKQMSGGGKKQAMQQMQQMFGGKTNLPF